MANESNVNDASKGNCEHRNIGPLYYTPSNTVPRKSSVDEEVKELGISRVEREDHTTTADKPSNGSGEPTMMTSPNNVGQTVALCKADVVKLHI